MSLNPIRCDQCIKHRRICDRALPFCQICINLELKCTYLTRSKKSKLLDNISGQILVSREYRIEGKDKRSECTKSFRKKGVKWKHINFESKTAKAQISKVPKGCNLYCSPLDIMLRFPKKLVLENLMTLVQYPSPYRLSDGLSLFLVLTEKLRILHPKVKSSSLTKFIQKPKMLKLNELIIEGIQNFFKYTNFIVPLFLESDFDINGKPPLLKLVIIVSGLLWGKRNEAKDYLINHFSQIILEKVRYPHRLKPSLESIQALLIIIICFRHEPATGVLIEQFFFCCNLFSCTLGLPYNSKNVNDTKSLERALACSCLNYISQWFNLSVGVFNRFPTKIELISKFYIKLSSNPQQPLKVFKVLNIVPKIILSSFHCDISFIFFSLGMLKSQFIHSNEVFEKLEILSLSILRKINQIESHYLSLDNRLNVDFTLKESTDYNNYILVTCHYLRYFLYTLYLYHPQFANNHNTLKTNKKYLSVVNTILASCRIITQVSTSLPSYYMLSMGIPNLTQCIIFMVRYKKFSTLELDLVIELGKSYLKEISKTHCFKFLSDYNLYFINLIEANI